MQEQHGLVVRTDLGRAVAQHACAIGLEPVARHQNVVDLIAEVVDAAVRIALQEFRDRMKRQRTPLSQQDLHDLALMKFRGGQPQTADEWQMLYLTLTRTTGKRGST